MCLQKARHVWKLALRSVSARVVSRSPIWSCAKSPDWELRGKLQISDLDLRGELRFGAPRRAPDLRFGGMRRAPIWSSTESSRSSIWSCADSSDATHLVPSNSSLQGSRLPRHYPSLPHRLSLTRKLAARTLPIPSTATSRYQIVGCQDTTHPAPAIQSYERVVYQDTDHSLPSNPALRQSWLPRHYPPIPQQCNPTRELAARTLPISSPAIPAYERIGCQESTHPCPSHSTLRESWLPGHYPRLPQQLNPTRERLLHARGFFHSVHLALGCQSVLHLVHQVLLSCVPELLDAPRSP